MMNFLRNLPIFQCTEGHRDTDTLSFDEVKPSEIRREPVVVMINAFMDEKLPKIIKSVPTATTQKEGGPCHMLPNESKYLMSREEIRNWEDYGSHLMNCIKWKIGNCAELSAFSLIFLRNQEEFNAEIDSASLKLAHVVDDEESTDHQAVIFTTNSGKEMVMDPYGAFLSKDQGKGFLGSKEDYIKYLHTISNNDSYIMPSNNYQMEPIPFEISVNHEKQIFQLLGGINN